jgi:hypothetical protein
MPMIITFIPFIFISTHVYIDPYKTPSMFNLPPKQKRPVPFLFGNLAYFILRKALTPILFYKLIK